MSTRVTFLLFSLLLPLATHDALACSPLILCAPQVAFPAGTQIPANAQGLPLALPAPMQAPFEPIQPQLRDAGGQVVPTELVDDTLPGWKLLKPLKGFTANTTYTMHATNFCTDPQTGGTAVPTDVTFTTGKDALLPTEQGTLHLGALAPDQVSVWTSSGSCTESILAARGVVALEANPLWQPWLPLTRAEVWVDGVKWSQSSYGNLPLGTAATDPGTVPHGPRSFHVACQTVPQYADAGLAQGAHHVDLRVHIAGAYADPAYLYGDVTVTCGKPLDPDAGATDGGTSEDASAGLDGAQDTAGSAAPDAASTSGCAASRGGATTSAWLLLLCALGIGLRRRGVR